MDLFLLIAIVVVTVAALFSSLFWRLASRFDASQCTTDWLDAFSVASYAPMERLLQRDDFAFLARQPGYRPEIGRRLRAERRRIFSAYLSRLVRDFNQLIGIGKLMVVYSPEDRQEFARQLWRQQIQFYFSVCSVRVQLALYPLGWAAADARRLLDAVAQLREQVVALTTPPSVDFA